MAKEILTTFQLKRGTAARWLEVNPVLKQGEPGFEYDTGMLKIGNGIDLWTDLEYVNSNGVINAATKADFPEVGIEGFIYKAQEEKVLYQWNAAAAAYEALSSGEADLDEIYAILDKKLDIPEEGDYIILYGGSATDNI